MPTDKPGAPPPKTGKLPTELDLELIDWVRVCAWWERITMRAFVERALAREVQNVIKANPEMPFAIPGGKMRTGRPLKGEQP